VRIRKQARNAVWNWGRSRLGNAFSMELLFGKLRSLLVRGLPM